MPEIFRSPVTEDAHNTLIGRGSEHRVYDRNDGNIIKSKEVGYHFLKKVESF